MELFDGSPRERYLLFGLGGVFIIALIALLLSGRDSAAPSADDTLEAALRDLQVVESTLASRPADTAAPADRTPFARSAVISTSRRANLTLSRVEPGPGDELTITFDGAPSENILFFLSEIERTTTGEITALEMEAVSDNQVEARVTLSPAS